LKLRLDTETAQPKKGECLVLQQWTEIKCFWGVRQHPRVKKSTKRLFYCNISCNCNSVQ